MTTNGNSSQLVVVIHSGCFTNLYKCLRSVSAAAEFSGTMPIVYIVGEIGTSEEAQSISNLPFIKLIPKIIKSKKIVKVTVLTSSTIISLNSFITTNHNIKNSILLPRYLVKIGQDFTIEDISHHEYPLRNFYTLHSIAPIRAGMQFNGRYAQLIINQIQGEPVDINITISAARRILLGDLYNVRYIDQAISFFRIDKYTKLFESTDFVTADRFGINSLLKSIASNNIVESKDRIKSVKYDIPQQLIDIGFTELAIAYWEKANEIDPQIRPSHILLDTMLLEPVSKIDEIMDLFISINEKISDHDYKHLVLVPHLRKGGADKAAGYLIRYLSRYGHTLVLMTEPTSSSTELGLYSDMHNVHIIDLKEEFSRFPFEIQIESLRLSIGMIAPQTIDIINSQLAYSLMASRYEKLNVDIQWYIHAYAHVYEEGYKIPPFHNGLCDAYPVVSRYFSDSQSFVDELNDLYGIAKSKLSTVYIPLELAAETKTDYSEKKRILWVGRICREKLFREVLEVADALRKDEVELEVWGPIDDEYITIEEISQHENVIYRGVFDSIDELNFNDYDMLLFTTINEGVPNVIIEASVGGLYIVAPAVGGIPETVNFGENAACVPYNLSAMSYYDKIIETYRTKSFRSEESMHSMAGKILIRHSWVTYCNSMDRLRNNNYEW